MGGSNWWGDSIDDISYEVHEYKLHAAADYQLFQDWLADNNRMSIYCQFCAHLVLQKEENNYPYQLLQFHGGDDEDRAPNHH